METSDSRPAISHFLKANFYLVFLIETIVIVLNDTTADFFEDNTSVYFYRTKSRQWVEYEIRYDDVKFVLIENKMAYLDIRYRYSTVATKMVDDYTHVD